MKKLVKTDDKGGLLSVDYSRVVLEKNDSTSKVWFDLFTPSLYKWVDLGLPSGLKWASCNVGATSPEEYGLYFAWGETEGYQVTNSDGFKILDANGNEQTDKTKFYWSDYDLCNGSSSTMKKYCTSSSYGTVDNLKTLETTDDAAYQSDNGKCRMPTSDEFEELVDNTTSAWISVSGVTGLKLTSKIEGYTDNSIFFPAAGYVSNGSLYHTGSYVYVWSSSLSTSNPNYAFYLSAYSSGVYPAYGDNRCYGRSVRPVLA